MKQAGVVIEFLSLLMVIELLLCYYGTGKKGRVQLDMYFSSQSGLQQVSAFRFQVSGFGLGWSKLK